MILFSTQSAKHIAERLPLIKGKSTIKQFSDGEIYVRIDEDIKDKEISVIASTVSPAENILELLFLLDALSRCGPKSIKLLITYFAYARQAIIQKGEACSPKVIADSLKTFNLTEVFIVQPHSSIELHKFLDFKDIIDIPFFCLSAKDYDVIAAPDKGALSFAQRVAKECNKELILLSKTRPEHEKVKVEFLDGSVENKRILLVDDIISTGNTLIEAAKLLKNMGAQTVAAAATHAVFASCAIERLQQSILEKIFITNTINRVSTGKIEVSDISRFLGNIFTIH